MENTSPEKRFALLIDADNVSAKYLKPILDELSKYGTVTYKRIYGDWTLNLHAKWKEELLKNSITPIQQFGYTQGKNATDSAMIIDAMDILYANSVEGFCIVSSDSDFTRLAVRLRESGRMVIGMGEQKTPIPFRTACDVFTTLELLAPDTRRNRRGRKGKIEDSTPIPEATATRQEIEQAIVNIISDNINNDKATGLGEIGSRLLKMYPDFDVRSYGTSQISRLIADFKSIVLKKRGYNIAVELADGVEPGSIISYDADEDAVESDAEPNALEENGEAEAEASETSTRRRRRRGGRGRKKAEPEAVEDQPANNTTSSDKDVTSEPSAKPAAETAVETPAEEAAPKKRTRRTRSKKAAEAEPQEQQAAKTEETAESPTEEPAPKKRTRRTRSKKAAEAESQEQQAAKTEGPVETMPATVSASSTKTSEGLKEAADDFVRNTVEKFEPEGILASVLSRRVRNRVKNFRLKDLGYKNFREYLSSVDGVIVVKDGSDHRVNLR